MILKFENSREVSGRCVYLIVPLVILVGKKKGIVSITNHYNNSLGNKSVKLKVKRLIVN